jgi:hypothetical protein
MEEQPQPPAVTPEQVQAFAKAVQDAVAAMLRALAPVFQAFRQAVDAIASNPDLAAALHKAMSPTPPTKGRRVPV